MKSFWFLIVCGIIWAGSLGCAMLFSAPAPFNNEHKIPQVVPGTYMMKWADSIPSECIFNRGGTYTQVYITQHTDYQWVAGLDLPIEIKRVVREIIIGEWKWDKSTRTLSLRERMAGGDLIDRRFEFELKSDSLETEATPTSFDKIHLSLKPVK